jgi:1-acyl-sn-glycerol-3-phosphate acyltransferase
MRKYLGMLINSEIYMLEKLGGIKVEEIGLENIPSSGAFIIAVKHMSNIDALIMYRRFPNLTALAKISLFRAPFIGNVLRKMEVLSINRGAGTAHKETPKLARKVKERGIPLLIFAEGTRIKMQARKPLKSGIYYIQKEANIPVVVVAHNAGQHWVKHTMFKEPGTIYVEYHSPIPSGLNKKEFMKIATDHMITGSENLMKKSDPDFIYKGSNQTD